MKNKIFIQPNNEEYGVFEDINNGLVSWSENRINDDDLCYISVSNVLARIKELTGIKEKIKINPMCSKAEYKAICKRINPLINELKNLIK